MYLSLKYKNETYKRVLYLGYKNSSKGVNLTVVGELEDDETKQVLSYNSYSLIPKDKRNIEPLQNFVVKQLGYLKINLGGMLQLKEMANIFNCEVKHKNSIIGENLLHCYDRADTLNGFIATENEIIAVTSLSRVGSTSYYNIADLRVCEVTSTPSIVDLSILDKFERGAFEMIDIAGVADRGTRMGLLDYISLEHYIQDEVDAKRGTTQLAYVKFTLNWEKWVTTPLTKAEKKELKRRKKKQGQYL